MTASALRTASARGAAGATRTPGRAAPTWWLVFMRELADLWIGGKALVLLFLFSVLMGVLAYVYASNSELSLIPPKEMVYETLKTAIAVGIFIGLIIGADTISGERERGTLEALLLTPTSRAQIVAGKFLAAITPWPAALLIIIPFLGVLAQGDEVFGQAVLYGAILGTVMAPAYVGIGMLVSYFSATNRTSYFVSLGIYILFLVPAQLPGKAQTGVAGQFLQWVNPMAATSHFLSKVLVNNFTVMEWWVWLTSPFVFAAIVLGVLFLFAPRLRLEAGQPFRVRGARRARTAAAAATGAAGATLLLASMVLASPQQQSGQVGQPLRIDVDVSSKQLKASDHILFNTTVSNAGTTTSPPLIVAMNIINLDSTGAPVDPEDWSPQRTQSIESLAAGRTTTLSWRVNAILDGEYMVYMVLVPRPATAQDSTIPVASPGIHLTVAPFTKLNPSGILPVSLGVPAVLGAVMGLAFWRRRRVVESEE